MIPFRATIITKFGLLVEGASSGLLINVWKLTLDSRDQVHGKTVGYVADEKLQSLLEAAMADKSPEYMDAFHQYLKEHAMNTASPPP